MDIELDYNLTQDQWETLKALRGRAPESPVPDRFALAQLVTLGLASIDDGLPTITAGGRSVLLRGSPRLLDLAS
jgi:hypothetical protein